MEAGSRESAEVCSLHVRKVHSLEHLLQETSTNMTEHKQTLDCRQYHTDHVTITASAHGKYYNR